MAYFFSETKDKKFKLKAPKPKTLTAGQTKMVKFKHRYGLMGAHLSIISDSGLAPAATRQPVVTQYEYWDKYYYVWIKSDKNVKGSFNLRVVLPNGKTAVSKKSFTY